MAFHRLTIPSYYGGLPGGYDYINNAGGGTPSFADGQKIGGPNAGTYFVAFGEDATSNNANRSNKALAQNTDYLDDLMHRDLAVPQTLNNTAPPGGVSSLAFGMDTFVGVVGTPNTTEGIMTFVKILDQNNNEINVGGTACAVTSIAGAVVGSGFSAGPVTFNISPTIPAGTLYRVLYATRGNLSVVPVDALTYPALRNAQYLTVPFEDLVAQVVRYSGVDVAALVATDIETPDGTRLPKSNTMYFDVDPDGTVGGPRNFIFRTQRATPGSQRLFYINDDTALGGGTAGRVLFGPNVVQEFLTRGLFRDANVAANAGSGGEFIPWSSATAQDGDQYLRTFDLPPVGAASTPTLLKAINGRWSCTVGDGVLSFGDFNGTYALQQALAYYNSQGGDFVLHIQLKRGSYTIDDVGGALTLPANVTVILEGEGQHDLSNTTISTSSTAEPIQLQSGTRLYLKNLTVLRSGGATSVVASLPTTSQSRLYADHCWFYNAQIYTLNPGNMSEPGNTQHFRDCRFSSGVGLVPMIKWEINDNSISSYAHAGFVFEDCVFRAAQVDTPVAQINATNGSANLSTMHGLRFVRCDFFTGSSTVVGGNPVGNAGPLEFADNGAFGALSVGDVSFLDCNVYAGAGDSSAATATLFHYFNTGVRLDKLVIDGGKWVSQFLNPAISPFIVTGLGPGFPSSLASPNRVSLRHVTTGWIDAGDYFGYGTTTGSNYGVWPTVITGSVPTPQQAAWFVTSPWVDVEDVTFVGTATQQSGTGLLWLDAAAVLNVDGVQVSPSQGGSGGVNGAYVAQFTPSFTGLWGAAPPAATRRVRRVNVENCVVATAALSVVPFGRLLVENCATAYVTAGTAGMHMPLEDASLTYAYNADAVAGLTVRACSFVNCTAHGFAILHDGVLALAQIRDLTVSECTAFGNAGSGIAVRCSPGATTCSLPNGLISGNSAHDNAGYQIQVFASAYADTPVAVVNNRVKHTNTTTDMMAVGTLRGAGDEPYMVITGNSCSRPGGFGYLGIRTIGGAVWPVTDSAPSGLDNIMGVEIGFAYSGGGSVNYRKWGSAGNVQSLHNAAAPYNM